MADTKLDQRTRQWTQNAGRAITYGPFARLADWWCASRDARIDLSRLLLPAPGGPGDVPDPGAPGTASWTGEATAWAAGTAWDTPRTRFLGQLGRGRAEKEWLRYQQSVAGHLVQRARAVTSRDAAERELRAARQRLDRLAAPTGLEAAARRSGEGSTDPAVVASRRRREFDEQRAAAQAEVQRWSAAQAEHDLMVAELSEPVRMRLEVAQHRAALIDAYVWRRRASYLTWLVRKHADGAQASSLIRSGWPERPAWAIGASSPDLADLAEFPADLRERPADLRERPADLADPEADLAQPEADLARPEADLASPATDLPEPSADRPDPPAGPGERPLAGAGVESGAA
jgi:hypothetical protein